MMKVLKYNGVGYNAKWVAHQDMDSWVESRIKSGEHRKLPIEERREVLKGVWRKCCLMCGINPRPQPKPEPADKAEHKAKPAQKKAKATKKGSK